MYPPDARRDNGFFYFVVGKLKFQKKFDVTLCSTRNNAIVVCCTLHSIKISGIFGPKLNESVRSEWNYSLPTTEVTLFDRSVQSDRKLAIPFDHLRYQYLSNESSNADSIWLVGWSKTIGAKTGRERNGAEPNWSPVLQPLIISRIRQIYQYSSTGSKLQIKYLVSFVPQFPKETWIKRQHHQI